MTDVDDFLAHFGVKGMKWGVRNESSSTSKETWKQNQIRKTKEVAKIAGVTAGVAALAVGAYYVNKKINTGVSVKSIPKPSSGFTMEDALKTYAKATQGSVNRGAAAAKNIKMDKSLSDFLADSARRQAADRKVWSESLNKGVDLIAREDAAFMNQFIKDWSPKMIGR